MKNFDIENLKKENIYKTPESFFPEMQSDVFSKLGLENPADNLDIQSGIKPAKKTFKSIIGYAVAASLVLFSGLIAFNVSADEVKQTQESIQMGNSSQELQKAEPTKPESVEAFEVLKNDIDVVELESKNSIASSSVTKKENKISESSPEKRNTKMSSELESQMDQVMQELTKTELADLTKGSAQDIYLDLYY